jgi:hypothetical protein
MQRDPKSIGHEQQQWVGVPMKIYPGPPKVLNFCLLAKKQTQATNNPFVCFLGVLGKKCAYPPRRINQSQNKLASAYMKDQQLSLSRFKNFSG